MCGAYGFSVKDAKQVYDRFSVVNTLEGLQPRWNVRPGQMNPVITAHSPNQISYMFWGLIPYFASDKNFTYKYKTINAKAETVAQLRTYREPLRRRRCLIPATGFYEPDKINYAKSPFPWHYFQLKSHELFAFAGLYDVWTDPATKKELSSYTLITTEPNELVGQFHPRMSVILQGKEDEDTWVNPDIVEPEQLQPLLKPYPADLMEEWAVGDEARNPRNDYPELIQPKKEEPNVKQGRLI
jgi:putative SOS response-associated peptidase YedK